MYRAKHHVLKDAVQATPNLLPIQETASLFLILLKKESDNTLPAIVLQINLARRASETYALLLTGKVPKKVLLLK